MLFSLASNLHNVLLLLFLSLPGTITVYYITLGGMYINIAGLTSEHIVNWVRFCLCIIVLDYLNGAF